MRPFKTSPTRARALLAAAAVAAALAGITGCDLNEDADLGRGQALFAQQCGSCHALTAAGTAAEVGPDLDKAFAQSRADGMDADTIEGVVQQQIANPRPADPSDTDVYMPADLVTGEDAEDVAAFVASVAGDPDAVAPEFVAPEFFAASCGSCHALDAAGTTGDIGPDLDDVLQGQSPAMISESITDPERMLTPGFPSGVMPANFEDSLSPQELRQLVRYLQNSVGGQNSAGGG